MPLPHQALLPLPTSDDEFDNMVCDILTKLEGRMLVRLGRKGQKQNGIDGFDSQDASSLVYQATLQLKGLQGKLTGDLELMDNGWGRSPSEFIFACGRSRDSGLQQAVLKINEHRKSIGKCQVRLMFWDELGCAIMQDEALMRRYYPFVPPASQTPESLRAELAVAKYIERVSRRTRVIATLAGGSAPLILQDVYEPLTIQLTGLGIKTRICGFPENLISDNPRLLIVDSAGMGKSTLLSFIANAAASGGHSPFVVNLRALKAGQTILEWLTEEIQGLAEPLRPQDIGPLIDSSRAIVLLDGLDEVSDTGLGSVIREVKSFSEKLASGRLVMTSRNGFWIESFSTFAQANIMALKRAESESLIRRYGSATGQEASAIALIEQIQAGHVSSDIANFLKSPLLASLLFLSFIHTPELCIGQAEYYDRVYRALYERHDLISKDGWSHAKKSGLSLLQMSQALEKYAFYTLARQKYECSEVEFLEVATAAQISGTEDDAVLLLEDLVHAVPILVLDGKCYRWSHRVLQDYFAAIFLWRQPAFLPKVRQSEKIWKYTGALKLLHKIDAGLFRRKFVKHATAEYLDDVRAQRKSRCAALSAVDEETWARLTCEYEFIVGLYSLDFLGGYGYLRKDRGLLSTSINNYLESVGSHLERFRLTAQMGGYDYFLSDDEDRAVSVRFRRRPFLRTVMDVLSIGANHTMLESFPYMGGTLRSPLVGSLSTNAVYLSNGAMLVPDGTHTTYVDTASVTSAVLRLVCGSHVTLCSVAGMEELYRQVEAECTLEKQLEEDLTRQI